MDLIFSDHFSPTEPGIFRPLWDVLVTNGDHYMHLADMKSVIDADQHLNALYAVADAWRRKAIPHMAGSGKFSIDHTIAQYAADIWPERSCVRCDEKDRCMTISPLAGKPAPKEMLVDLTRLEREYFARLPDFDDPEQRVSFGTSGHRGHRCAAPFTEAHILAITQAICDYRRARGTDGPLLIGKDTRALSGPAQCAAPRSAGQQTRCRLSSSKPTA